MDNTTVGRALFSLLIILVVGVLLALFALMNAKRGDKISNDLTSFMYNMTLTSNAFTDQNKIPSQFTCDGSGTRPTLNISDVPSRAESLAITMHDPDAIDGTFVHWTVWNIPATTTQVSTTALPIGAIEGVSTLGKPGWVPPCPPINEHRYVFTLYALSDSFANLNASTTKTQLESAIKSSIMAQTILTGLYERKVKK